MKVIIAEGKSVIFKKINDHISRNENINSIASNLINNLQMRSEETAQNISNSNTIVNRSTILKPSVSSVSSSSSSISIPSNSSNSSSSIVINNSNNSILTYQIMKSNQTKLDSNECQLDDIREQNEKLIEKFFENAHSLVQSKLNSFNCYLNNLSSSKIKKLKPLISKKNHNRNFSVKINHLNKLNRLNDLIELRKVIEPLKPKKRTLNGISPVKEKVIVNNKTRVKVNDQQEEEVDELTEPSTEQKQNQESTEISPNNIVTNDVPMEYQIDNDSQEPIIVEEIKGKKDLKKSIVPVLTIHSEEKSDSSLKIMLVWNILNIENNDILKKDDILLDIIKEYEIYGFSSVPVKEEANDTDFMSKEMEENIDPSSFIMLGTIESSPPPIKVVLTDFTKDSVYYFSIRIRYKDDSLGSFSKPKSIEI